MEVSSRSRVDLPAHVPNDFEVFVGGLRQARGTDYEVIGRTLVKSPSDVPTVDRLEDRYSLTPLADYRPGRISKPLTQVS